MLSGTVSASGADLDNMIIAKAASGETSITVTSGFSFGTQDFIRIGEVDSGFTINSGSFSCSPGGSFIQIIGNHLETGGQVGSGMQCHDWLIDANTMSGSAHDYNDVYQLNQAFDRSVVYNVVFRNNVFGDWASEATPSSHHVDFIQHGCWIDNDYGWTLTEGNTFYDISGTDQHFHLAHCIGNADDSYNIIRYNKVSNAGGTLATTQDNPGTFSNWVVYNNTLYEGSSSGRYWWVWSHEVTGTLGAENNLIYDSMDITWNIWGAYLSPGICHGNLYFDPDGTQGVNGSSCYTGAVGVLGNVDPLFSDPDPASSLDFSLGSESPAINAGYHLTNTDGSGSGTSITVNDPIYFQDGWAGIDPDCIAVGTVVNTACIERDSINYSTGAMTLTSSLSAWGDDDEVWLYKKSDGVTVLMGSAPDIGAVEYDSGSPFAVVTGTISDDAGEAEIVSGGETLVITLGNDTWVATVGDDNEITDALIAGIDSAQSEAAGWDIEVKANSDALDYNDVTRDSTTVISIELDPSASYVITADEAITVTIPAIALTAAGQVIASPIFSIITSDSTEPILSGEGPSLDQLCSSDPASVSVYVTTDENAYCRYSSADGTYASMSGNQFTVGEGFVSHSVSLSLACGASYTRYITCIDISSNEDTHEPTTSVSFDVLEEQSLWGDDSFTDAQYDSSTTVRMMGGTSPDIDNMILEEVYCHQSGTGTTRLAVYQGGTLDDPNGATLVWDTGTIVVPESPSWVGKTGGTGALVKNEVTWIGWKGDDFNYATAGIWDSASDFQEIRGRWQSATESVTATNTWDDTIDSAGGNFGSWWYVCYLVYGISIGENEISVGTTVEWNTGDTVTLK